MFIECLPPKTNGSLVSVVFPDAVRPSRITSLIPAGSFTASQWANAVLASDDVARIILDLSPFVVFVYPVGATTPSYPNLSEALRTARQLEAVGHHISAIKNDTTILEGVKLRAMLGERPQRPSLFPSP
jgi:hypothetical protein